MVTSSSSAPSVPTGPPQRVLVVEDLEDTRASLQELLQLSLGLEVDTAEDGAKGLALLRERPYSLVITDLRMPKVSGMKLIEAIQAEVVALRAQLQGRHAFRNVLSKSPRMHDVFELVAQIADTTSTVLIHG